MMVAAMQVTLQHPLQLEPQTQVAVEDLVALEQLDTTWELIKLAQWADIQLLKMDLWFQLQVADQSTEHNRHRNYYETAI
jgi:hypothetical protein